MSSPSVHNALAAQKAWATSSGLPFDERGYVSTVEGNLRRPLSTVAHRAFEEADGAELRDRSDAPAKMRALLSSSALAVNVFDYWMEGDIVPLASVLGARGNATGLEFERKLPTGARGTPPNLDVVLTTAEEMVGIESKFTEWMTAKSNHSESLAPYFRSSPSRWEALGLSACARLAEDVYRGAQIFSHLDVPQLLKHALGLSNAGAPSWALTYVWYDTSCGIGDQHREELARFATAVGTEIRFRALSYQSLVKGLSEVRDVDGDYLAYLRERYGFGGN